MKLDQHALLAAATPAFRALKGAIEAPFAEQTPEEALRTYVSTLLKAAQAQIDAHFASLPVLQQDAVSEQAFWDRLYLQMHADPRRSYPVDMISIECDKAVELRRNRK
jgi:hypothetical protein